MSIKEIIDFIHFTKISGYVFDLIIISGGEPLLWDHLVECVKRIRDSHITKKLSIFSNGIALEKFQPRDFNIIYNHVNSIRITNLGINSRLVSNHIEWLSNLKKFHFIDYSDFIVLPDKPLENVLPADCGCPHFSFTQGKLNVCTLALDMFHRLDFDGTFNHNTIGFPLCLNYLNDILPFRTFNYNFCRYCISNNKVRSRLKRVPNVPLKKEVPKNENF